MDHADASEPSPSQTVRGQVGKRDFMIVADYDIFDNAAAVDQYSDLAADLVREARAKTRKFP
jgi:hypothetical protein